MENHASAKASDQVSYRTNAGTTIGRMSAFAEFAANSLRDAIADSPELANNGWVREAQTHLDRIQTEYNAYISSK